MKKLIFVLVVVMLASMLVMAQEEKAQVFAGYNFTSVGGGTFPGPRESVPKGWNADLAIKATKNIAFVADFSGAYKYGVRMHNIAGGVRFSAPSKITPFAEALVGVANRSAGGGNHMSMLLGGGLDVNINKNFAFRLAKFDYNLIRVEGYNINNLRYATGIVFKF